MIVINTEYFNLRRQKLTDEMKASATYHLIIDLQLYKRPTSRRRDTRLSKKYKHISTLTLNHIADKYCRVRYEQTRY